MVRIAWVFGLNGKNFIKTMLNLGKTHDTLTVVDDQIGTPTYTYDLARLLVDMLEKEEYGKYHATNEGGYISWCDFAKEIFRQAGMDVKVLPVSSAEYPAKAKRPTNSRLEKKKLEEKTVAGSCMFVSLTGIRISQPLRCGKGSGEAEEVRYHRSQSMEQKYD